MTTYLEPWSRLRRVGISTDSAIFGPWSELEQVGVYVPSVQVPPWSALQTVRIYDLADSSVTTWLTEDGWVGLVTTPL